MTPSPLKRGASEDLARRLGVRAENAVVWVRVGRLFDGLSESVLTDAHLVYDAKAIRHVGASDRPPPPHLLRRAQSSPDAELSEHTVLPGLIDAHAHLFLDGGTVDLDQRKHYLEKPSVWLLERARSRCPKIVRCGVMAVRDAGDKDGVGLALAAECAKRSGASSLLPYVDSPGAAIHHRGRYGSFMAGAVEEHESPEACVRQRIRAGADRIKLIATGIINFKAGMVTAPPQMTTGEVEAFVRSANGHGRQTFAHASGADGITHVIDGGVTTVEHGFFLSPDQMARMRDRGIGWVPTFAPVQAQIDHAAEIGWDRKVVARMQKIIEEHGGALRCAHEMGVTIIAGSDAGSSGVPHGVGMLTELELMQRAGMPTSAVLRSATGLSASTLNFKEPIGRLARDYRARMIFTSHDPLDDVTHLRRQKIIVFDGQALRCDGRSDTEGL